MNKKVLILFSLFFFIYFALSQCNSDQININTASLSDLDKLTGIGPAKAQAIIDIRPYSSVDDLDKVKGIGSATVDKIKQQGLACVSSETQALSQANTQEPSDSEEQLNLQEDVQNTEDSAEDTTSVITSKVIASPRELQANQETQPSENIINLNSDTSTTKEEIIYESKNEIIRKYAIYAFVFFLVLIIAILLIKK